MLTSSSFPALEALPVKQVSHGIDRIDATFDDPNLVPNAGLLLVSTLVVRLGLEAVINQMIRLAGREGGALPGRKVLTLVSTMVAGYSHIDHVDVLRAGATREVLPFRVMAPSTIGTFLRAFTFGHVRQFEAVIGETLRLVWSLGAGPGGDRLVIDIDSTITEVHGKQKQGAAYGYTRVLGYHPLVATRADTGEVLHARCGRVRPTPSAARSVSWKSSSPESVAPARPARSSCAAIRGSGQTKRSRRSGS